MAAAPLQFHIHMLVGMLLFAIWPFTRLVHAFTAPLHYLFRPYIVYRSRDAPDAGADRPPRAGWSPVGTRDRDRDSLRSDDERDRQSPPAVSTQGQTKNLALATLAFAISFWAWNMIAPLGCALHRRAGPQREPEVAARRDAGARRLARAGSSPAR